MTLKELIDDASNLGLELPQGLDTEVVAWNLGHEPLEVAGVARASGMHVGASKDKKSVVAYITIKP